MNGKQLGACHTSSHLIVDIVSSCYRRSIFYQLGAYKNVIHTTPVPFFFFELRESSFHIKGKMHPEIVKFSIRDHLQPVNTTKCIIGVFKTLLLNSLKVKYQQSVYYLEIILVLFRDQLNSYVTYSPILSGIGQAHLGVYDSGTEFCSCKMISGSHFACTTGTNSRIWVLPTHHPR